MIADTHEPIPGGAGGGGGIIFILDDRSSLDLSTDKKMDSRWIFGRAGEFEKWELTCWVELKLIQYTVYNKIKMDKFIHHDIVCKFMNSLHLPEQVQLCWIARVEPFWQNTSFLWQ